MLRRRFKRLKLAKTGCVSPTNLEAAFPLALPQVRNMPLTQDLSILQEAGGRRFARRGQTGAANLIDNDDVPVSRRDLE